MPPHPSTNFEIQKYYPNEPKFNGVYSRYNLHKTKDGAYAVNMNHVYDECESVGPYRITLYGNVDNAIYFDSFGVDTFQKKLKNL